MSNKLIWDQDKNDFVPDEPKVKVWKCNPNNSCVDCKNNGINIKITNKCNCNCSFCIEKGGLETEEKPVETLVDATNLLGFDSVLILGGEPLLFIDKVEEIVNHLRQMCSNFIAFSNGTFLLNEETKNVLKI